MAYQGAFTCAISANESDFFSLFNNEFRHMQHFGITELHLDGSGDEWKGRWPVVSRQSDACLALFFHSKVPQMFPRSFEFDIYPFLNVGLDCIFTGEASQIFFHLGVVIFGIETLFRVLLPGFAGPLL